MMIALNLHKVFCVLYIVFMNNMFCPWSEFSFFFYQGIYWNSAQFKCYSWSDWKKSCKKQTKKWILFMKNVVSKNANVIAVLNTSVHLRIKKKEYSYESFKNRQINTETGTQYLSSMSYMILYPQFWNHYNDAKTNTNISTNILQTR